MVNKTKNFQYHRFFARSSRGFSLIELLAVVAIIGVIAAIVSTSLSTSRSKGANAGLRTSLAQMRTQANLYFNDNGNYGTVAGGCGTANTVFSDQKFVSIRQAAENSSGYLATCVNNLTGLGSWAVLIQSKPESGNDYLCTDYTGKLKAYPSPAPSIAGAFCP